MVKAIPSIREPNERRLHFGGVWKLTGFLVLAGVAMALAVSDNRANPLDDLRKEAEKRTGIRIDVPTPGEVLEKVKEAGEGLVKAGGTVIDAGGKVLTNANREINVFAGNVSKEGNKGLENIGREANKGINDIIKTVQKAGKDTEKAVAKAGKDVEQNIAKSGRDVEDAAHAIGKYIERSAQSTGKSADKAMERMRQGKFVDAVWHAALDPLQNSEENAALAAQESSLIRTVGQVAASAYGGPSGAAAYAAWLTYKATGSFDTAMRVGLITGATAVAFQSAGKIPSDVEYGLIKKTLVTAAIGGGAIAASGGSPDEIKDGFLSAAAMVLVQDHYQEVTKKNLDQESMKASKPMPAYCIDQIATNCTPVPKDAIKARDASGRVTEVDPTKLDRRVPGVGLQGSKNPVAGDNSVPMKLVSKVPGMQGMSVMHDSWVTNSLPPLLNQPTIVPAIIVYYTGTGAPYYGHLQKTAVEHAINRQARADAGKKPSEPSAKLDPKVLDAELARARGKNGGTANGKVIDNPVRAGTESTDVFVCRNAKEEKSWLLMVNAQVPISSFSCRFEYQTSLRSSDALSFTSFKDKASCGKRVKSLVRKALGQGMTCMTAKSGRGPKTS